MRAVRGLVSFIAPPRRRLFFRSRRDGHGGVTSDRKDGPIGEMSDDESSVVKLSKCDLLGGFEDEVDNECCICLVDMEERKFRGKMDCCDHVVCWFCIQEWAQKTARTCPICQRSFHKCKKTKAKRKKGRRHITLQDPNGGKKKKKERTLWENVRRRFSNARPPSSPSGARPWSDAEDDNNEVDAVEEEVIAISPMHDSQRDYDVAADGGEQVNSSSSSNEDDGEERNVDSNSNSINEDGGGNAEEGSDDAEEGQEDVAVVEEERSRGSSGVDEEEEVEEEEEEVVVAAEVEVEAVNNDGEETEVKYGVMVEEEEASTDVASSGSSEAEVDVEDKEEEEEEEDPSGMSTTETNFIAERGEEVDSTGKGKERISDEEQVQDDDGDYDEEEWERKGNGSSDEEEEDFDYDDNGPCRLPEDN